MSAVNFLSESHSLHDLFSRMVSPDREECEGYKALKVEGSFVDRIFIVYKPTGLNVDGSHRNPEILTQVKVLSFQADAAVGAAVELEDLTTHEVMTVGYIPKRLFNYDAFISVPPRQRVNWDAANVDGVLRRSMSFGIMIKTRSKAEFYSYGVTSVETPTNFRALFPNANLTLLG